MESNQNDNLESEAYRMSYKAIKLGVNPKDIIIDDKSNNTFENIDNSLKLLPNELKHIIIITSEFHLKRCLLIFKKKYPELSITMIPSKDGYSDQDNWFLSSKEWNSGRSIVEYEAHLLVKYAREGKIYDMEINNLLFHK